VRPDVAVDDGVPGAVCPIGQVHAPQSTAASGAAPARPWLGGRRPDPCQLASPRGHPSCRVSPAAPDAWRVQLETRVAGGTPSPAPSPWTWLSNTSAAQQPLVVAPPLSLARAAGSCQRTFYVPPQPGSHEVHSSRLTACTVPPVLGRRMQHSFRRGVSCGSAYRAPFGGTHSNARCARCAADPRAPCGGCTARRSAPGVPRRTGGDARSLSGRSRAPAAAVRQPPTHPSVASPPADDGDGRVAGRRWGWPTSLASVAVAAAGDGPVGRRMRPRATAGLTVVPRALLAAQRGVRRPRRRATACVDSTDG